MGPLIRFLELVFAAYAVGLITYIILSWMRQPRTEKMRRWLEQWYQPFLAPLRSMIKPMRVGNAHVDFAPGVLLLCIFLTRHVVFYVLVGRI